MEKSSSGRLYVDDSFKIKIIGGGGGKRAGSEGRD